MGRKLVLVAVALALLVVCVAAGIMLVVDRGSGAPATAATAPGARGDDGWHRLYFTAPRFPDRPENRTGGIDQHLVAFIDQAQRSLDVAVYEFDLDSVADALVRARNRNVAVRMVLDTDTLNDRDERTRNAVAKIRNAGIPIVGDNRSAIMHHKFVVRDTSAVWTGSYNFTINDTFRNNNNAIEIRLPDV
ncbi:MAG: phospholipase D-like domain-containing protein, partial [Dehalococcoidia bacterium]|nr:phospholipase D-like domain-containing protein [Dehalococcoidia bacterium]